MSRMTELARKHPVEGVMVRIFHDATHAFFVGKTPDGPLVRFSMGAFRSFEAARAWADQTFPGGSWQAREAETAAR